MRLTRRYRFSASHRLDTPALTAEENRRLYGKCNNAYGHGHDYLLDVSVAGNPGASGQLVDRRELDALVSARVLDRLDHKSLNADVPELAGIVPTTENLAFAIQRLLQQGWTLPARLEGVCISETARNIFELKADK